jgi:hypothetical protein
MTECDLFFLCHSNKIYKEGLSYKLDGSIFITEDLRKNLCITTDLITKETKKWKLEDLSVEQFEKYLNKFLGSHKKFLNEKLIAEANKDFIDDI